MQSFNLKIVTSDGVKYTGEAQSVMVRSVTGDVNIWAKHIDYVTALGIGKAVVTIGENKRVAACNGGVLSVLKGEVSILATTFEWQDEIDLHRANAALEKAKEVMAHAQDARQIELAKLRIQRALTRIDAKDD
ncbi:MAG: ATP synthase F1 subunit epsilon [Oscillospiraceae bacterium]